MGAGLAWLQEVSLATHILCLLVGMLLWHIAVRLVGRRGQVSGEPHEIKRTKRNRSASGSTGDDFRRANQAKVETNEPSWLALRNLFNTFKRPSITYHAMFTAGFACSLLVGLFQRRVALQEHGKALIHSMDDILPESVQRSYNSASNRISQAIDQMLTSDTVERLLNTTSTLKDILDSNAWNVSDRWRSGNSTFGIAELFSTWSVPDVSHVLGKSERVGIRMSGAGLRVHHPVVMIPGIITTGLEVWDGEACIKSYFRQRIWGTTTMFRSMISDPECWLRHLALNATTGLDPLQLPHLNRSIRVRPAQGFESADFFLGGYWLWGLMIEALADIGYDLNSMYLASFDWRLSFADMERRDRYFTRLRQQIETLVSMNGQKAVVVPHSMGGNVWHYFMQWVTHNVHSNWVHDHIAAVSLISAPLLGVPKAYYSLLIGDNRDFAAMGRLGSVVFHFLGPMKRRSLWRSMGSLAMIIPLGEKLWGDTISKRSLVRLNNRSLTTKQAYDLLAKEGDVPHDLQRLAAWLLDGARRTLPTKGPSGVAEAPEHVWANALATPLPFAPQLRMYALYGVGVQTEDSVELEETGDDLETTRYSLKKEAAPHGFHYGDGDYSCPVASLGLMCKKGWSNELRNPARIPCTVKEYPDTPPPFFERGRIRGGPASGDHIDLLGNEELLTDILTIVSGGDVDARIVSDLPAVARAWSDQ